MAARGVPTWLHEGLADCFDGSDVRRKEEQVRQADARIPLARLEGSFTDLTAKEAALAYAESAVAVHMLLDDVGAPAMVSLLTDLGHGVPLATAFERNMLRSYPEFQKKLME